MAAVRFVVGGSTRLMMKSAQSMIDDDAEVRAVTEGGKKKALTSKKVVLTVEQEVERATYRMANGGLGFPATAFNGVVMRAAKGMKSPLKNDRSGLLSRLMGTYRIEPDGLVPVTRDGAQIMTYDDIDVRTVVNNNTRPPSRLVSYRPLVNLPWEISFDVIYQPDWSAITNLVETIRELLDKGGVTLGIGAFRPEKTGSFGQFSVLSIEEL